MSDKFDVSAYVTVNERIQKFWKDYPEGRIVTSIFHLDGAEAQNRMVVVKAEVYLNSDQLTLPSAVDYAKEREGVGYVSKTSFIENAVTSAIGRALATKGFLVDKNRASQEEMLAVKRAEEEHIEVLERIKTLAKDGAQETKTKVKASWPTLKEDRLAAASFLHQLETKGET